MHPVLLLVIYSAISVFASLSGGWVPLVLRLTHRRMQIAISFVSGVMLGIGLMHLLPHSFEVLQSIDRTVGWVMAGFLFTFFLERFFHFHHHEAPGTGAAAQESDTAHSHRHDHDHDDHGHRASVPAKIASPFAWGGAAIGLTLHGLVDGVAMAAAVKSEEGTVAWAGLGAFLAIALHKPLDSLTIGTLMSAAGRSATSRHLLNALYSLVTPLGVVVFYAFSASAGQPQAGLGQALGFAAGAFICIATSDLLPELQFHHHDRTKLSIALLVGIALAWGAVFLEEHGHDHSHGPESAHADEHEHQ